jgi:hypothetical protein
MDSSRKKEKPVFDPATLSTVPVNEWLGEWLNRETSAEYRGCMALQLYVISKKHGRESAKAYRQHVKEIGHYPTPKQR